MGKFKFQVEVGCLIRSQVRNQLYRSKEKLEYNFPGSFVSIREEKTLLDSKFFVQGVNFPDTQEFGNTIRNWIRQINSLLSQIAN